MSYIFNLNLFVLLIVLVDSFVVNFQTVLFRQGATMQPRIAVIPTLVFMNRDDVFPVSNLEIHTATVQEKNFHDVQFTEENIRRYCQFSGLRDLLMQHYYLFVLDPRRKLKL
jgi:hypothetical protein